MGKTEVRQQFNLVKKAAHIFDNFNKFTVAPKTCRSPIYKNFYQYKYFFDYKIIDKNFYFGPQGASHRQGRQTARV